jgi:hypothetical protein
VWLHRLRSREVASGWARFRLYLHQEGTSSRNPCQPTNSMIDGPLQFGIDKRSEKVRDSFIELYSKEGGGVWHAIQMS